MSRPELTLYLDVVSPFAYLAFHFVRNSPIFKPCDVNYVPIFLGGVMKACGNVAPINIKNKDKWINNERMRWAKLYNIPISATTPEGFPPNTISAMRALCAIQAAHPDKLADTFAAMWDAFWVKAQPIAKPEVFGGAIVKALGEAKGKEVLEAIATPEVKQRLQANTDKALEDGAFGLPWFVATNAQGQTEGFWGFDHLGQVIDHLGLERGNSVRAMM